jgi:hypothetical protein
MWLHFTFHGLKKLTHRGLYENIPTHSIQGETEMKKTTISLCSALLGLVITTDAGAFSRQDAERAFQKGVEWLKTNRTFDVGELFAMKETAQLKSGAPIKSFYEEIRTANLKSGKLGPYEEYFGGGKHDPEAKIPLEFNNLFSKWLLAGMWCDHMILNVKEKSYLNADNNSGYTLTHQLLAIRLFEKMKCDFAKSFSRELKPLTRKMAGEISFNPSKNRFLDLDAERLAVLFYAGHGSLVKKEWIGSLVEKQLANGAWAKMYGNQQPSTHATILSLWTLAGWLDSGK